LQVISKTGSLKRFTRFFFVLLLFFLIFNLSCATQLLLENLLRRPHFSCWQD